LKISKNVLQKHHFTAQKVKNFLKNGIVGGAFYKKVGYVILKAPLKLKGCKKSLEGRMWPAGRTLAMPAIG
jgi:hypothetical protein